MFLTRLVGSAVWASLPGYLVDFVGRNDAFNFVGYIGPERLPFILGYKSLPARQFELLLGVLMLLHSHLDGLRPLAGAHASHICVRYLIGLGHIEVLVLHAVDFIANALLKDAS